MFNIASQLKNYRQKKGYSQIDVFTHTGIHNKTLSGYERGVSTPDIETLRTLLIFYEASADDFFLMPNAKKNKISHSDISQNDSLQQSKLLKIYSKLDDRDQETILKMAETLLGTQSDNIQNNEITTPKRGA